MNNSDSTSRNRLLDIIKALCIIFVITTHFTWQDSERLTFLFPFWIDMAVPFFMLVSGYSYALSYKRRKIDSLEKAYCCSGLLDRALNYIIPFTLFYLIEITIFFATGEKKFTIRELISCCFVFLKGGYGPGSFYFPLLIQLIFLFPMIFMLINKYQLMGLIQCGVVNLIYELTQRVYDMNSEYYRLIVLRYVLLIACGCYLAVYDVKVLDLKLIISFIVGGAFIFGVNYTSYNPQIIRYWTGTSFLSTFYVGPIACFLLSKAVVKKETFLAKIGEASYYIYLAQMTWYISGSSLIRALNLNRMVELAVNLIVCLGAGITFYLLFSKHISKISKKIANSSLINGKLSILK
ncbi:Fucose 4-O-acetylase [Lachnospiraceae bacterium G11]|nr:Fucose 4-O-acetylase [Lachnospiraceae bacterium G11]